MENNNNDHVQNGTENLPQVTINAQYVKDLSFENPNAPINLAGSNTAPSIELNLDLAAKALNENLYEVAMQIKAKAMVEDKVLFIVDLTYAGLFTITNIPQEHLEFVLLVQCPSIIFPYARRVVSDATRDGGFQPLMVDPVDFATLYANKKKQETSSNDAPVNLTGMPNYN